MGGLISAEVRLTARIEYGFGGEMRIFEYVIHSLHFLDSFINAFLVTSSPRDGGPHGCNVCSTLGDTVGDSFVNLDVTVKFGNNTSQKHVYRYDRPFSFNNICIFNYWYRHHVDAQDFRPLAGEE
jgi:hypothetical protein